MQDQDTISEPQTTAVTPAPAKIVDIMAQPASSEPSTASVAAPDPELVSEPAVEPAPAVAPAERPQMPPKQDKKKTEDTIATPTSQHKQPSTVPVGAIISAIIIFIALAAVALLAFRQGY